MLDPNILESIYSGLKSDDKDELLDMLRIVGKHINDLGGEEKAVLADAIMGLFYLDEGENPGLSIVYSAAGDILVRMGPDIVEVLIGGMVGGGLYAEYHIAQTLGKIGKPAIKALKGKFRDASDPTSQGLALFALSSIDDPALIEIFDEVIALLDSKNPDLRDSAVAAIGTMVDCIGGLCLEPTAVEEAFEKLFAALSDTHGGTRSKAVKSIGKLAKKGYLNDGQKARVVPIVSRILGIDGAHKWDHAFIVRREAEEAYFYLTGEKASSIGAQAICDSDS
jgi:HEAT repeat protein